MIDSSGEEEGEAEEEGEEEALEVGADGNLSSTAPPAMSHAQPSRLALEATKRRLTIRPLRQPAPPTPPIHRTRLPLPRPPVYLLLYLSISLDELVNFAQFHPQGVS